MYEYPPARNTSVTRPSNVPSPSLTEPAPNSGLVLDASEVGGLSPSEQATNIIDNSIVIDTTNQEGT